MIISELQIAKGSRQAVPFGGPFGLGTVSLLKVVAPILSAP